MSAREDLLSDLILSAEERCAGQAERDQCRADAQRLVDAYAHELAEQQRDMLRGGLRMPMFATILTSDGHEPLGTTHVIDHIDPEITTVRPARVALAELRPEVNDG